MNKIKTKKRVFNVKKNEITIIKKKKKKKKKLEDTKSDKFLLDYKKIIKT
jgi:hypothetical protein